MKALFRRFFKGSSKNQQTDVDPSSEAFFESRYQDSEDPWKFATSAYELSRYDAILKALPPGEFRRAFEPGCSVGVLTEQLAQRCRELHAIDISATAVSRAQQRCRHLSHVHIRHGALPNDIPDGTFDLILFSEIGYYFRLEALGAVLERLVDCLVPGGILLASHWLGKSPDHVLQGGQVHDLIGRMPSLRHLEQQRSKQFQLDLWVRERKG